MENKLLLFYPVMIGFWALCLILDLIFLPFTGLRIAWPAREAMVNVRGRCAMRVHSNAKRSFFWPSKEAYRVRFY